MNIFKLAFLTIIFSCHTAHAAGDLNKETLRFIYKTKDSFTVKPYKSYALTANEMFACKPFSIDYKNKTITINDIDESTHKIITDQVHASVIGKWFQYSSKDGVEFTNVLTRNLIDYSYEFVQLNHSNKTYAQSSKRPDTKYLVLNDFILVSEVINNLYILSFITSMTKDKIEYIDCQGESYYEEKYTNQKLLEIPEDYKE